MDGVVEDSMTWRYSLRLLSDFHCYCLLSLSIATTTVVADVSPSLSVSISFGERDWDLYSLLYRLRQALSLKLDPESAVMRELQKSLSLSTTAVDASEKERETDCCKSLCGSLSETLCASLALCAGE